MGAQQKETRTKKNQIKPKIIFGTFKCQLFPMSYEVYIGEQSEIEDAFCENNPSQDISGIPENIQGAFIPMFDKKPWKGAFLFPKNSFSWYVLAHETSHATWWIFRHIHGVSDGSHNEPEAYYQDWLIRTIFEGCKADPSRMMVIG